MSKISFKESESAVSAVVSAVLLLGIMVSIITVINVSYIPEWRTGTEQAHMDEVFYDMASMKSDMDILAATINGNSGSTISVSSPIRMGGGNIPVVSPGKSSGMLSINSGEFGMMTTASDASLTYSSGSFLEDLGSIGYLSSNSHFVDQTFLYESGALTLVQKQLSLMKQSPSIDIRRTDAGSNITLDINAVQLTGPERMISSNAVEEVHARYNYSAVLYASENLFTEITLVIDTDYPSSWENFLRTRILQAGLYPSEYSLSSNATSVTFTLEGQTGQDIKANIKKTVFDVNLNVFEN
ncbi:hypothetical protein V7O66_05910 [Methanolobus sp. ZRKC3]|uniref:DUF7289 family protein n=1 Tax=Methanolobus sp. ZRKC3 TaxID=3125786 RepID=UPI003250A5BE